jgi:hypothetical protein
MSLNKVLNRPMFRKEALRQGVLKVIKARTGRSIGPYRPPVPMVVPQTGIGTIVGESYNPLGDYKTPAIRKPATAFERFKVSGPARLGKNLFKGIVNVPFAGGYYGGEKVAEGLGINNTLAQMPFGMAGGYYASRALPALAGLGTLPSLAILGTAYGGKELIKAGIAERKRINAMSPKERKAFETQQNNSAFDYMNVSDQELFGNVRPKTIEEKVEEDKRIVNKNIGSGRVSGPGFTNKSKELKAEGDELLQNANDQDIASLDNIQENTLTGGTPPPPGDDGITNYKSTLFEDRQRREAEALLTAPEKKEQKAESTAQGTNEIALGGPSTDIEFNKTIALAKKYNEAIYKGEGSQAGLVFLANLASGLLTGTTAKAGIGGALEVFGQAIGPAVNNYATIKLKEGELRARNREASLNAAFDHMKFLNDAAIAEAEGRKPPEIDQYGIIQVRGADGRLRNHTGIMYKNGTVGLPVGLDANGVEQYMPVPQGGPIKDSGPDGIPNNEDDRVIGSFEQFKEQAMIGKDLIKYHDTLGNKYTALSITRDVLKTLSQTDSSGEQVKAGAALSIDQFTRRLTGVAQEVFGLEISNFENADAKANELYQQEKFLIENDASLDKEGRKKALALIDKESLIEKAKKRFTKTGRLSGLSRDEQEQLAVQEVSLVYALANSFKDQDRLTQRDVDNAQKIVNIFSLGRSSLDVKASIGAIALQLESNIRTQETLYTVAGGLESTLSNLRQLKNFTPFEGGGGVAEQLAEDLSIEEIESILEGVE